MTKEKNYFNLDFGTLILLNIIIIHPNNGKASMNLYTKEHDP